MTQSIQVLDQRTQRDLQYVEKMEIQLRGLETKFRQVEESHKQNIAKQYKVHPALFNHLCLHPTPLDLPLTASHPILIIPDLSPPPNTNSCPLPTHVK